MKALKNTKFLEAVAASIQKEKDKFDFYLKIVDAVKSQSMKDFFNQLAEDVEEHIKLIQNIYTKSEGVGEFPNLKELNPIHKFHTTTIAQMMKRLDRNMAEAVEDDELKLIEKTLKEEEEEKDFYNKLSKKFKEPNLKLLFQKLANFSEENKTLIESHFLFLKERSKETNDGYYWEDEELMKEASKGKAATKPAAKKKTATKPAAKKKS